MDNEKACRRPPEHAERLGTDSEDSANPWVEATVADSLADADRPHVLLCFDLETGTFNVEGPFPDGMSALCAAAAETEIERRHPLGLAYRVMPLIPPRDHGPASR